MVLKLKLGHLIWTVFLRLKHVPFSSTPPSFDSTVLTLSRDIVHEFEKTHRCQVVGKKADGFNFFTNTYYLT